MTTPDPGVSAWQVYQQLAQLSAKLDVLLAQTADHEARLRLIEKNRWPIGNVTVLIAIASLVVAVLLAVVGRR